MHAAKNAQHARALSDARHVAKSGHKYRITIRYVNVAWFSVAI